MFKTLVVGCGHMGRSHAKSYHQSKNHEIVGLVSRGPESRNRLADELGGAPCFDNFYTALENTKPDLVSINTYPETHAEFAIAAMEAGAHVFLEKPLATTMEDAEKVIDCAKKTQRKLLLGYILRQHPSWTRFVEIAQELGKPLVMRMNLNQQSQGEEWETHKQLMNSISPIVDCGVHYVDQMCLMTNSHPIRVSAIGARLSEELNPGIYNYGQLQVSFEDGSVGWYEAGWGPMMSEEAFFVKDVVGPKGSVSIKAKKCDSDDVDSHTKTGCLLRHHAQINAENRFVKKDEWIDMENEPTHLELCDGEQKQLLRCIQNDEDMTQHWEDCLNSLKIVLAADLSFKEGRSINL